MKNRWYSWLIVLVVFVATSGCRDRQHIELEKRQAFLTSRRAMEDGILSGMLIDNVIEKAGRPTMIKDEPSGAQHYYFIAPLPLPPKGRDCGGVDVRVESGKVVSVSIIDAR